MTSRVPSENNPWNLWVPAMKLAAGKREAADIRVHRSVSNSQNSNISFIVAWHLAEARFWVLRGDEDYHEPAAQERRSASPAAARALHEATVGFGD